MPIKTHTHTIVVSAATKKKKRQMIGACTIWSLLNNVVLDPMKMDISRERERDIYIWGNL